MNANYVSAKDNKEKERQLKTLPPVWPNSGEKAFSSNAAVSLLFSAETDFCTHPQADFFHCNFSGDSFWCGWWSQ